jgi:hypothetical protein
VRRKLIGLVVAQAALAVLLTAPSVLAASSQFAGTWLSIDTDGSTQTLVVSGGSSPAVTYEDFYASSCANNGSPATHWVSAGSGSVDGNVLSVEFHKSGCGWSSIGGYSATWVYDPATDTLTDDFGNVYYRFH